MKRITTLAAMASLSALTLTACGGGTTTTTDTETTKTSASAESTDAAASESSESSESASEEASDEATTADPSSTKAPERADADLVIWADDLRAQALKEPVKKFADEQGIKATIQIVAQEKLRQQAKDAVLADNGPDVIVGAHDWLGEFVQDGVVAPVQMSEDIKEKFDETAIEGATYNGQVYGAPYAIENIGLIRNTKLVPEAPKTMEELVATGQKLVKDGKTKNVMSLQVGKQGDAYHIFPFLNAYGGGIFEKTAKGYDANTIILDSPETVKGAEKIAWLAKEKALSTNIDSTNSIAFFAEGKTPFLVSGPWAIQQAKEAGIDLAVSPIPAFEDGGKPVPFRGVQMFFVSAKAENETIAQEFVNNYVSTPEVQEALYDADNRPPALTETYKKVSADNDLIKGWFEAGDGGSPMPAIPAMNAVWTPLSQATADIVGGKDAKTRMTAVQKEIEKAVKK